MASFSAVFTPMFAIDQTRLARFIDSVFQKSPLQRIDQTQCSTATFWKCRKIAEHFAQKETFSLSRNVLSNCRRVLCAFVRRKIYHLRPKTVFVSHKPSVLDHTHTRPPDIAVRRPQCVLTTVTQNTRATMLGVRGVAYAGKSEEILRA